MEDCDDDDEGDEEEENNNDDGDDDDDDYCCIGSAVGSRARKEMTNGFCYLHCTAFAHHHHH